ncbi:MAG TPA: AAA family ATPase [Candidatus Limnocylindria bacterium]|nr:AAA family ATPase [Candidatus Limnocylindria bacterium]
MTEAALDLYVLDPDPQVLGQLRPGLAKAGLRLAGSQTSADRALPVLMSTCPDVVLIDVASSADIAFSVKKIQLACPSSCIIVTGAGTPPTTMSRAVASGARGFLIKPYTPADVFTTIGEALEMARAVASQVLVQAQPSQPTERARGTIVAVYSPKGGVGSTTVATNLAVALAARPKTSVALLDLDLQFGDIGSALDLRGANSVAEVVGAEELTSELIDETFVKHASGIRVLLAPDDLALVEGIDPEGVVRLLSQLRRHFDYVVADLWSSFEALTLGVLRAADRVLLVTTPELPSLRNVQRVLQATRADLHLDDKTIVVANRYPGKTGLSQADMSKALGQKISATIPSEGITVTDAINRGLSLLDSRARVRIARHYHTLASLVADVHDTPAVALGDRLKEAQR